MDVARMNFSHGSHADHEQAYHRVRDAADAAGRAVATLADLQGPKIRLGKFENGPYEWRTGDSVVITSEEIVGTATRVSCTYRKLPEEVKVGDRLLIDDGKVAVEVTAVTGPDIRCLVIEGGPVSNNKGVSLPNVAVSVPALSEKDIEDLRFALRLGVDLVALSFVRSPDDIKGVHQVMQEEGAPVPSSRRSRSRRRWPASRRSCSRSTASWWPAATWASSSRSTRYRWCRNARSSSAARSPSR
jgi:pyruvate kinase